MCCLCFSFGKKEALEKRQARRSEDDDEDDDYDDGDDEEADYDDEYNDYSDASDELCPGCFMKSQEEELYKLEPTDKVKKEVKETIGTLLASNPVVKIGEFLSRMVDRKVSRDDLLTFNQERIDLINALTDYADKGKKVKSRKDRSRKSRDAGTEDGEKHQEYKCAKTQSSKKRKNAAGPKPALSKSAQSSARGRPGSSARR